MRSGITLDNVTPHLAMRRKVALGGLTLLTVIILMITYVWVGIDPFKLYDKRQNAMSYLFGRQMTEDDKAAAMAQARRLPKIILLEETLQADQAGICATGKSAGCGADAQGSFGAGRRETGDPIPGSARADRAGRIRADYR
jgi:phosphonate transport system permease protein